MGFCANICQVITIHEGVLCHVIKKVATESNCSLIYGGRRTSTWRFIVSSVWNTDYSRAGGRKSLPRTTDEGGGSHSPTVHRLFRLFSPFPTLTLSDRVRHFGPVPTAPVAPARRSKAPRRCVPHVRKMSPSRGRVVEKQRGVQRTPRRDHTPALLSLRTFVYTFNRSSTSHL